MTERKIFKKLTNIEDAFKIFYKYYNSVILNNEKIVINQSNGRVLSQNIFSQIDVPGFDRATMDGYAINAENSFGAKYDKPINFKVIGESKPGIISNTELKDYDAIEISTGAPIPVGSNAVVIVENTEKRDNNSINIFKPVIPGENIMYTGSDIMNGELILRKNTVLTPREIGLIAAIGLKEISVYRKPIISILSTGDELTEVGKKLVHPKIYDVNSQAIISSLTELGCITNYVGIIQDDFDVMKQKIVSCLKNSDLILTSGSTSAGAGDMLYNIINDIGEPGVIVHGLNLKPGKPTFLAVIENKPIIGLPGYPTSALMIFNVIVKPLLLDLMHRNDLPESNFLKAFTIEKFYSVKGRRELFPVQLIKIKNKFFVYPIETGSGAITTLSNADGFIDIAKNIEYININEPVKVNLFSNNIKPLDLLIIGSHCIGLDLLLDLTRDSINGFNNVKIINTGSLPGLNAINNNKCDISGIHLIDVNHDSYNISYVKKCENKQLKLINGYSREQGLIIQKNNPKQISSLKDLFREDIRFINRNTGSGTRILLEILLKKMHQNSNDDYLKKNINGYDYEAKTHSAVAAAVKQKKADVGFGIKTNAYFYNLDFIPIAQEKYDFVVNIASQNKPLVKQFISTLKSKDFAKKLALNYPGLNVTKNTGKII